MGLSLGSYYDRDLYFSLVWVCSAPRVPALPCALLGYCRSCADAGRAVVASRTTDPFTLSVDGDKLRGRGTTDCLGHVVGARALIWGRLGSMRLPPGRMVSEQQHDWISKAGVGLYLGPSHQLTLACTWPPCACRC